jgi:hypothetical protein
MGGIMKLDSHYLVGLDDDNAKMVRGLALHYFEVYRGNKGIINDPSTMRLALRYSKGDLAVLALGDIWYLLTNETNQGEEKLRAKGLEILSSLRLSAGIYKA